MAMNMRSRGLAASTNRPRVSVRPVYEDFKPPMESKEDAEAHTVYIHLSGFSKEQIRIVAESSRGLLRVRGERLVAGNTSSRFSEEIPVPGNCDITETRAKFEGGVLQITMPKRIYSASPQSSSPAALSDEATTPERSPLAPARPAPPPPPVPSRPVAPPPSRPPAATRPAALPPPRTPARTEALPPSRRKSFCSPPRTAATRPEDFSPQRTSATVPTPEALPPPRTQTPRPAALPQPRTPEPRLTPSIQPKPRDDTPQPPRQTSQPPLPQPESARYTPSIHPKAREHEKPQFEAYQKPSLPLPQPTAAKYSPPGLLQALPQPDPAPRKDPIASDRRRTESDIPAPSKDPIASDRRRTESDIPVPPKAPVKTAAQAAEGSKRYEWLTEDEKHRKGERGVSVRELEEDRQLVVNMGVAVMVIVAFGAWISHSFGSSANPSN